MSAADHTRANGVATALLAGSWTRPHMSLRVRTALGLRSTPPWVRDLVADVAAAYRDAPRDRPRELTAYLVTTEAWERGRRPRSRRRTVRAWTPAPTTVVRRPWPIAELADLAALRALLDVDQGELDWFADLRGWERRAPERLRHYTWRTIPKRAGTRLVAAPKPRLKEIQRRLLRHVLAPIPVHDAAHGGVPGRSIRTALAPHTGRDVVIRADLRGFFAAVPAARVWGVLRTAGLPEAVAHATTGLLTTVAPRDVSSDPALRTPHLPQGAPTSPRTADLVAFRLDRRLQGLAARFGAAYTRYVDDLTFSGDHALARRRDGFLTRVEEIVRDEGFAVHPAKTRVLGSGGRQQLLGAVVNTHPAVSRVERDRLRALVHNCATRGWHSQAGDRSAEEFRAWLLGRIAWVGSLHPEHGRRLRAAADRISWDRISWE